MKIWTLIKIAAVVGLLAILAAGCVGSSRRGVPDLIPPYPIACGPEVHGIGCLGE